MSLLRPAGHIVVYLFVFLYGAVPVGAQGGVERKAIVLGWDGVVPSFIHEMLRDRKLPNIAKLISKGAFADDVVAEFPSLTATGFASLWTGAPPRVTGITGNRVPRLPRRESTILESVVGFDPALLRAETLSAAAERAGRKTIVAYAPLGRGRFDPGVHLQAYTGTAGRDGVVAGRNAKPKRAERWTNLPESLAPPMEFVFKIGAATLYGLLIDDPGDEQQGYDTAFIGRSPDGQDFAVRLKPAPSGPGSVFFWSSPVEIATAGGQRAISYFRLFELNSDGTDFLLYFTRPTRPTITLDAVDPDETNPSIRAFIGNGANLAYARGAFGATIPQGGDGTAEARYVDTVFFLHHQLMETSRWVLEQHAWTLFSTYSPYPDEAEHLWRGYLDPASAGFRPDIAARLRPFLERVYQSADELLGVLMGFRPENTIVALVSDHGMEATDKRVAINVALQRAELLKLDEKGRVDLAKTKAYYPSFASAYLLINSDDRKNGTVTPGERDDVMRRIRDALLAIRDGERQVVTAVHDAQTEGALLGVGGESGGDVYIDLLPGYELDARLGTAELIAKRDPHGMHGFNPARTSMRTVMALTGPGVKASHKLTAVQLIDFAPTLAKLLGIPAPRHAWGRVLEDALIDSQ